MLKNRLLWILGIAFFAYQGLHWILDLSPDFLWFDSFGYASIWWRVFSAKWMVFLAGLGIAWVILGSQVWLAFRISRGISALPQDIQFSRAFAWLGPLLMRYQQRFKDRRALQFLSAGITLLVSGLMGVWALAQWEALLLMYYQVPFGVQDPVFLKDIGFYVFSLPIYEFGIGWIQTLLFVAAALVTGIYFAQNLIVLLFSPSQRFGVKRHILLLLALWLFAGAVSVFLSRYDILFSSEGVVHGAGYTDVYSRLPGTYILAGMVAIFAAVVGIWGFRPGFRIPIFTGALTGMVWMLVWGIWPSFTQNFVVAPDELGKEAPYIRHAIAFTRQAYQLDAISSRQFPVSPSLTSADIRNNRETIDNIRLWNSEPFKQTVSQLQEIRLYYEFLQVDLDRYFINGKPQQVLISVREMDSSQLADMAKTWVNQHLVYTHGYGLVVSPVNQISADGMPIFFVKDFPPTSTVSEFKISRPEIYFGEKKDPYVIVNTGQPEFDYPKGDSNVFTHYAGQGGVALGSWWRRAFFAYSFSDLKFLISDLLKPESRVLFRRDIDSIVKGLAPFLAIDHDPYPVLTASGRIVWMLDGYTLSSYHPYSEPVSGRVNYIRNPVKITIDAYSGETKFYIRDTKDPLIQAYAKLYPALFTSFGAMPKDLKAHIRYPKDIFWVQAKMYQTYHMTDPQVFYNREDVWSIPKNGSTVEASKDNVMSPHYTVMKVPGDSAASFILMLPFTPTNKNNMIAWLSADCDLENYGDLTVFNFPKDRTVYGPQQVESRISQDTVISQSLTLWGQGGSQVIRGDLAVIPIENSLLYAEPIYLRATNGKIPELKRVVVAFGDDISMQPTLEDAIRGVFSGGTKNESPLQAAAPGASISSRIQSVVDAFSRLKSAARSANWREMGTQLTELDSRIQNLSNSQ